MRPLARLASRLLPLALAALLPAEASAQYFGLELRQDSALVGEVVPVHVKVHIGIQQNLAARIPSMVGALPEGVRLLGMDTLSVRRTMEGAVLEGDVRFAFYRPGIQDIPRLRLILRPIASDRGQVMEPEPLTIRIVGTIPEGNPTLKDIRDQFPRKPVSPWLVAAGLVGVLVLLAFARWASRRRGLRASGHDAMTSGRPDASAASPLATALAELAALDAQALYRSDVAAHYDAVAEVLRRYFIAVAPATTRAQTSSELLRALGALGRNGAWHATRDVLGDADLVKFAGQRPGAGEATRWTGQAREALTAWSRTLEGGAL